MIGWLKKGRAKMESVVSLYLHSSKSYFIIIIIINQNPFALTWPTESTPRWKPPTSRLSRLTSPLSSILCNNRTITYSMCLHSQIISISMSCPSSHDFEISPNKMEPIQSPVPLSFISAFICASSIHPLSFSPDCEKFGMTTNINLNGVRRRVFLFLFHFRHLP